MPVGPGGCCAEAEGVGWAGEGSRGPQRHPCWQAVGGEWCGFSRLSVPLVVLGQVTVVCRALC